MENTTISDILIGKNPIYLLIRSEKKDQFIKKKGLHWEILHIIFDFKNWMDIERV